MTATIKPGLPERYYAPSFSVDVEQDTLPPETAGDVLEIKVVMDLEEMNSAEIKLNNFDDATMDLKWSDSKLFRLGNRMHVQLGYADEPTSMLQGQITSLAPDFPSSGPPTLTVRALDGMVRLKGSKPRDDERVYRDVQDWEIAVKIAQRNGMKWKVDEEGPKHTLVVQPNQDDAVFLMERASRIDFDVFVLTDPDTRQDVLHFLSPKDGRDDAPITVYELMWGSRRAPRSPGQPPPQSPDAEPKPVRPSLIEFAPIITGSAQVKSVTVRGWDPTRKAAISATATPQETPGVSGTGDETGPGSAGVLAGGEGKKDVIVDVPVLSQEEAQALAEHHLAARSYEYLTGKGKVIGLPNLRPGDNVHLDGLGTRFSGMYYVTKVTHTLGGGGFTTEFDVRKTYAGGSR